jgi:hypothetical protein
MRLPAGTADAVPRSLRGSGVVAGFAHHLVAEDDCDLSFFRAAFDGFQTRLPGGIGVEPSDVVLEPAHEKQQADDGKRPRNEHYQQEYLIGSHIRKCLRP